jgi:hypothetical protein
MQGKPRVWKSTSPACPVCKTEDNKVLRFVRHKKITRTKYRCSFCNIFYAHIVLIDDHPKGEIKC